MDTSSFVHRPIRKRVNSKITLLKRLSYYITHDIQSTFDYCCPIWGSSKKTQTIIEKSEKRIAGIILNKSSSKIDTDTIKDVHWLTFEKRCIYYTGVLVYKSRAHLIPKNIEDLLQFAKNEHYKLRSTNKGDLKTIACVAPGNVTSPGNVIIYTENVAPSPGNVAIC